MEAVHRSRTVYRRTGILALLMLLLASFSLYAQPVDLGSRDRQNFYFDAISFEGPSDSAARVDVFVLVPYQLLQFTGSGDIFGAQYSLVVTAYDSLSGKKVSESRTEHRVSERNYSSTRGASGNFDHSQNILSLAAGTYRIEVLLFDALSKNELSRVRSLRVPNFKRFNFAISGAMLVSAVEQREQRYVITPHISDNVASLSEGFFAFFESYNRSQADSADFVYEIVNSKGTVVSQGERVRKAVGGAKEQHFIKIAVPKNLETGTYALRILALQPSGAKVYSSAEYLATTERSIQIERSLSGVVLNDITRAIRQLRYVASQSDVDQIEEVKSPEERQQKFEEFWLKLDPTPNTPRNEAFEDYYARIDYANRNFRSYTEGWLTDMGMVYIIYGPPGSTERQPRSDGRVVLRWTYPNNNQIVFVDNSGFGDFRLASPFSPSDKYRYGR